MQDKASCWSQRHNKSVYLRSFLTLETSQISVIKELGNCRCLNEYVFTFYTEGFLCVEECLHIIVGLSLLLVLMTGQCEGL